MKKYIYSFLLLLLCSGLLYQWFRTVEKLSHCDARIAVLQRDQSRIEKYRYLLANLDEQIKETDRQIALLRKRLPTQSGKDAFAKELIQQFTKHDIEATLQFSNTREKDFYEETVLTFVFKGDEPDVALNREIFHNIERLAQWKSEQDQPLQVKIFSSPLTKKMAEIAPCTSVEQAPVSYWPFNSKVRERLRQIDERCARRNRDKDILLKTKQLENRRRLFIPLQEIVSQLLSAIEQTNKVKNEK